MLIKQQKYNDNTFYVNIKNGIVKNAEDGKLIPQELIANFKILDGQYLAYENTCQNRCSLGEPKHSCIYDGVYKGSICSKITIE